MDDQQASFLFWLTMLALGCVSMLCMTWGASTVLAQKGPEKLLRAEQLLPKLKSIHWQWKTNVFRPSGPTQHAKAPPKDRNTPPHAPPPFAGAAKVTVEETPHHSSAALPLALNACDEPIVYLNPCSPQPGESPMMRTWKMLSMYSVLTAAATLADPSSTLLAQDDTKIEALRKDVEKLSKKVDDLVKKPVAELDKSELAKVIRGELKKLEEGALADLDTNLKAIKKSVNTVKDDITSLQAEQLKHKLQLDNQKTQIDLLTEEVAKLNRKVIAGAGGAGPVAGPAVDKAFMDQLLSYMKRLDDTIAKLGPTETRTSMSPPIKNTVAPTFGRVVFNNHFSRELLFIVNGRPQAVPPMTRLVLDNIPAGTVRCEVAADGLGLLDRRSVTLGAGETFTLRATDQP